MKSSLLVSAIWRKVSDSARGFGLAAIAPASGHLRIAGQGACVVVKLGRRRGSHALMYGDRSRGPTRDLSPAGHRLGRFTCGGDRGVDDGGLSIGITVRVPLGLKQLLSDQILLSIRHLTQIFPKPHPWSA